MLWPKFCEFRVACPNEMNCGWQVDYSNDMVAMQMIAGLANMEHQSRILVEAISLTTLEQKFNRLVSLETTDKSTPHLHNIMHPLALSSVQRSDHKRWFQETKTFSSLQYAKPCRECGRNLHPSGSMSQKDCPVVRLVCHNCGLTVHLKKVCWKLMTSREEATNWASRSEESVMFANKIPDSHPTYTDRKRDLMQLIAVPHLIWNGKQFQRRSPEPPPSVTMEITMMPRTHATFNCMPTNTVSYILTFVDTRAQICLNRPEIQRVLGYPDGYLMQTTHQIHGIIISYS